MQTLGNRTFITDGRVHSFSIGWEVLEWNLIIGGGVLVKYKLTYSSGGACMDWKGSSFWHFVWGHIPECNLLSFIRSGRNIHWDQSTKAPQPWGPVDSEIYNLQFPLKMVMHIGRWHSMSRWTHSMVQLTERRYLRVWLVHLKILRRFYNLACLSVSSQSEWILQPPMRIPVS